MSEVIKLKADAEGRLKANLYGKEFDLTELAEKDGKGEFMAFGETYNFEVVGGKSRDKKFAKKIKISEKDNSQETPIKVKLGK